MTAPSRVLTLVLEIPIRWGDLDAMGHVNNTVYFRYMEQARISWFDRIGVRPDPLGEGPVIINAACTFLRPFGYPGTVIARHSVGAIGRSSVDTAVEMSLAGDARGLYATGTAKVVWIDARQGRSAPISDAVRERMRQPWSDG